jgi:hypothetical protein
MGWIMVLMKFSSSQEGVAGYKKDTYLLVYYTACRAVK